METPEPMDKDISDLTINDFAVHPVWTWKDDEDESLVVPLEASAILPEDHDALFVACEFQLSDGTRIQGVLSVRMSDHHIYVLSFPGSDGRLFRFPLQPQLKGLVTRQQLAGWLQRSSEEIFPIIYRAPYAFSDGKLLAVRAQDIVPIFQRYDSLSLAHNIVPILRRRRRCLNSGRKGTTGSGRV